MDINKSLKKMLLEEEKKARENLADNVGHISLMKDITSVFEDAKNCEFHDMLNVKYAAPKVALVQMLEAMKKDAMNGKYDN